jgi:hypothetical protein
MNAQINRGIPLRADPDALDEVALATLTRACLTLARGKVDPNLRQREFATARWGAGEARSIDVIIKAASAQGIDDDQRLGGGVGGGQRRAVANVGAGIGRRGAVAAGRASRIRLFCCAETADGGTGQRDFRCAGESNSG